MYQKLFVLLVLLWTGNLQRMAINFGYLVNSIFKQCKGQFGSSGILDFNQKLDKPMFWCEVLFLLEMAAWAFNDTIMLRIINPSFALEAGSITLYFLYTNNVDIYRLTV